MIPPAAMASASSGSSSRRPRAGCICMSATVWSGATPLRSAGTGPPTRPWRATRRRPLGEFYICAKNPRSKFFLSMCISYPNAEDAERGLAAGLISPEEHGEILAALREKRRAAATHAARRRDLHPWAGSGRSPCGSQGLDARVHRARQRRDARSLRADRARDARSHPRLSRPHAVARRRLRLIATMAMASHTMLRPADGQALFQPLFKAKPIAPTTFIP